MSEFKFVQWGKGVPVDYQRLNAMMLNDQYLKDKVDPSPRGILIWREAAQPSINSTSAVGLAGFTNLTFDVEANRMIKITWDPGDAFNSVYTGYYMQIYVDNIARGNNKLNIGWGPVTVSAAADIGLTPSIALINNLAQGSHSVTIMGSATQPMTGQGTARLLVEDIGQSVAES